MAGEGGYQMGSMYWSLGLKGTLVQDTAAAEGQINKLEAIRTSRTTRAQTGEV